MMAEDELRPAGEALMEDGRGEKAQRLERGADWPRPSCAHETTDNGLRSSPLCGGRVAGSSAWVIAVHLRTDGQHLARARGRVLARARVWKRWPDPWSSLGSGRGDDCRRGLDRERCDRTGSVLGLRAEGPRGVE